MSTTGEDILLKVSAGGGAVSARTAMAAFTGILLMCDHSMLAEFGGLIKLSRTWDRSLLKQINSKQSKGTTQKTSMLLNISPP